MRCFAASVLFLLGACASGAGGGPAAMPDRSRVDITTPQGNSISLQETPEREHPLALHVHREARADAVDGTATAPRHTHPVVARPRNELATGPEAYS